MLDSRKARGMEFFTTDQDGVTLIEPDAEARSRILESVLHSAADYPEVYLTHQRGVVLGYRSGGYLIREEDGEVIGVLSPASIETATQAWTSLATSDFDSLDSLPWRTE